MATLVKFVKDNKTGEITAIFPQLKWSYKSNDTVTCYAHIGQHSAAHVDWIKAQQKATQSEYLPLKTELKSIGYILKVCK